MKNECLSCKKNCCKSFLIYMDLIDEDWWERDGKKLIGIFQKNLITGRFSCEKFDGERNICSDYENRPEICKNTGENGMYPHDKCLLKKQLSKNFFKNLRCRI